MSADSRVENTTNQINQHGVCRREIWSHFMRANLPRDSSLGGKVATAVATGEFGSRCHSFGDT